MAKDLSGMKTQIWAWTDTDSVRLDGDQITSIVNGIIADLARSADSLYNEFSETFPTISGTSEYDISSTLTAKFSRPFSMWVTGSSGDRARVGYLPPEIFEKKYKDQSGTGEPIHYTIFAGNIIFGPVPDDAYSIRFRFYGYPADLSASDSTNEYLQNAWDVILYGSLGEVCLYLIEDNRKAQFKAEFHERKRRFLIEQGRARTSGYRPQGHEQGWMED